MTDTSSSQHEQSILGLSTSALAGVEIDDLANNPTAIRMVMHYYKRLVDENNTLKNDNNTLKTYVDAYQQKKSNASTGTVLMFASNISIGFGVNLLTGGSYWPGGASFISGLCMAAAGAYFGFLKDRR
jgi:hypothetical protein